jgi:hypothetical protein
MEACITCIRNLNAWDASRRTDAGLPALVAPPASLKLYEFLGAYVFNRDGRRFGLGLSVARQFMRGRRTETYPPALGLAMLCTKEITERYGPPPRTLEEIGAWMGISRQGMEQEVKRIMRKVRIRMIEHGITTKVMEEFHKREKF